ncbi:MAG: TIGR00295 family protein [Candidatus Bathyarchaeia archaeon]
MALRFLKKSGCSRTVVQHCKNVSKLAVKIAKILQKKGYVVDLKLVEVGALLHDIGRSKTHSVHHAIAGAEIAKSFALPDPIVRIIERHVGAGIPEAEAKTLGWPEKSYMPETLEEKIVTYADKLIEGTKRVDIEQTIAKTSEKLGKNHPANARLRMIQREFESLLGEF